MEFSIQSVRRLFPEAGAVLGPSSCFLALPAMRGWAELLICLWEAPFYLLSDGGPRRKPCGVGSRALLHLLVSFLLFILVSIASRSDFRWFGFCRRIWWQAKDCGPVVSRGVPVCVASSTKSPGLKEYAPPALPENVRPGKVLHPRNATLAVEDPFCAATIISRIRFRWKFSGHAGKTISSTCAIYIASSSTGVAVAPEIAS